MEEAEALLAGDDRRARRSRAATGVVLLTMSVALLVAVRRDSSTTRLSSTTTSREERSSSRSEERLPLLFEESRERFEGGVVRKSCVNNDDDGRFASYCPPFDEEAWCSHPHRTGPGTGFHEVCAEACADPDRAYAMVCAWQAVANMRAVCDGTFKPVPPIASENTANEWSAPLMGEMHNGGSLYDCDDHAVCYACFSGAAPTEDDGEMCERVAAHYGGFGHVFESEELTGAGSAFRALQHKDWWCDMLAAADEDSAAYDGIEPAWVRRDEGEKHGEGEYVQRWGTPGAAVRVEEHVIRDARHSKERFTKDAYAYWRYALVGEAARNLDAEVHVHTNDDSLRIALAEKRVGAGALIFVDFLYALVKQEHFPGDESSLTALGDPMLVASGLGLCPLFQYCADKLNRECVYQHSSNVVLRAPAFRDLLAYERPLTIVIAGDLSCKLSGLVPLTHHHVVFANDGAQAVVDEYNARLALEHLPDAPRASFFPFGLEGVTVIADPTASSLDADSSGEHIRDDVLREPPLPAKSRSYFVSLGASLNRRKPSRTHLYDWLVGDGGYEAIEAVRRMHPSLAALETSVVFEDDRPGADGAKIMLGSAGIGDAAEMTRRSLFTVAPAGDFWTSGRVLESAMLGSIPIVDQTYLADGGESAKGCDDPARFWRQGSREFPRRAPFVFVDDWARLPQLLDAYLHNQSIQQHLDDLAEYREALEDHLRAVVLPVARRDASNALASSCRETPLSQSEVHDIVDRAKTYYSTNWFLSYQDSPANPGVGCTKYPEIYHQWPEYGAYCFDDACAPPLVKSFECSFDHRTSGPDDELPNAY